MPKYKLPNGKTIFSETELSPDELDELASEGEPKFESLQNIPLNKTADVPVIPEAPVETPVVPEEQGFIDKVLSTANAPMVTLPSQGARQMSGYADQLSEKVGSPAFTSIMKALSGVNEFVGDTASSLTSPINAAMTAATGGSSIAARTALPAIARALGMAGRGLSAGVTAAGGYNLANADSVPEGLAAILELVGGGFGMKQKLPAKGNLGKIAGDVVVPPKTIIEPELEIPNIDNKPPIVKNIITDQGDVIDEVTGEVIDMTDTGAPPIKPSVKPPVLAETPSIHPESKQPIDPIKHKPNVKVISDKEGVLNNPSVETVQQMNDNGYYTKKVNEDGSLVMTKRAPKPTKQGEPESLWREIYNLPRGMMSVDLPFATSAAFRQAKPFIGTANWFKAWKTAAGSFQSEEAFQNVMTRISSKPLFQKRLVEGKVGPSVAEEMGLDMTDLKGINGREEALRSSLAERIPLYGKYIRASNRAYTGFLNDLRANTLEDLFESASKLGRDPITKDKVLGQQIAEFINTATGRGKLGIEIGSKQVNLEKNAKLLSDVFFAPKLMASNVRMLNPSTYITADPFVRKQYMLGMLRAMGTWGTIAGMAKFAGADVSLDPRSSDFGKIRIGNTRIDLGGGMQQYLVLAARESPAFMGGGKTISSTSGKVTEMGKGFRAPTRTSTAVDFAANKLHPTARFAWDLMSASDYKEVGVGDRVIEMALPMFMGDLKEIIDENPELAPLVLGLGSVGIGSQTYEGGPPKPSYLPREYDYVLGGKRR